MTELFAYYFVTVEIRSKVVHLKIVSPQEKGNRSVEGSVKRRERKEKDKKVYEIFILL